VISVPTGTDYHDIVTRYNPQVQTGVIWLLSATAVLTVWFNIPLHFFHRAILLGFSSYLIVFATLLNVLRSFGFDKMIDTINVIDAYAYLALVTWWAFNAWRKDHAFEVAPIRQPRLATGAA
jgi:type IV secretory pathway TraG/TraD family ATPase VirD4